MRTLFATVALLALGTAWSATAPDPGADADFAAFTAAADPRLPSSFMTLKPSQQGRWTDEHFQHVAEVGWAFYRAHPADPRRWDVAAQLIQVSPEYFVGFKPSYDEDPVPTNYTVDEARRAQWERRKDELRAALRAAPDLTDSQRETALPWLLFHDCDLLEQGSAAIDPKELGVRVEAFANQFPKSQRTPEVQLRYASVLAQANHDAGVAYYRRLLSSPEEFVRLKAADALREADPKVAAAELKKLAASGDAFVSNVAAGRLSLVGTPFSLKFTALDGRDLDVAKLHGKVVLVDYWATWCGPCLAELPNIKKVYAAYHDKGFEVIGIALENAQVAKGDSAEQAAAKIAKARKKLVSDVQKRQIPWPQYFDGKYYDTEAAKRYGIYAIPAMFLLNKQGLVVSTDARGERLESEVKRLLSR
jgi:thiol-disulfide isomerase/thioredoxin